MKWLESIVSTTLVVLTGCILAVCITIFYIIASLFSKDLDPILFGSMLAFIGSCMGIGYKQFKAKRETAWAEDEDGIAYRPGTRVVRETRPNERFNAGIKKMEDFSDVNILEKSRAPVQRSIPAPPPELAPEPHHEPIAVPEEEKWEGDD